MKTDGRQYKLWHNIHTRCIVICVYNYKKLFKSNSVTGTRSNNHLDFRSKLTTDNSIDNRIERQPSRSSRLDVPFSPEPY